MYTMLSMETELTNTIKKDCSCLCPGNRSLAQAAGPGRFAPNDEPSLLPGDALFKAVPSCNAARDPKKLLALFPLRSLWVGKGMAGPGLYRNQGNRVQSIAFLPLIEPSRMGGTDPLGKALPGPSSVFCIFLT